MDEEEMLNALVNGAILHVSDYGEAEIMPLDDIPEEMRECIRASKAHEQAHFEQCPDCLEDEARSCLMDAAFQLENGNEANVLALEADAVDFQTQAAKIRAR